MKCKELMKSEIRTCKTSATAQECAQIMRQFNIGIVPVSDASGKPIGVVTDRDLVVRVLAEKQSPNTKLKDFMSKDVLTCKEEDDVRVAEDKMTDGQKSRIVVVDAEGKCVGVISLSDVAQIEDAKRSGAILGAVTRRESSAAARA